MNLNSHLTRKGNAWKFVKTLHVKFFPFGSVEPVGSVTVKLKALIVHDNFTLHDKYGDFKILPTSDTGRNLPV